MTDEITKECQALHNVVSPERCAQAQTTLPRKYCEGCDWCHELIPLLFKPKPRPKKERYDFRYIVYLSKFVKEKLIERCEKTGLKPSQMIARIVLMELVPEGYEDDQKPDP